MGRRVLITGLDTFWGGRMAQTLEADPDVEMILGMGTGEPRVPLERTEYVRSDQAYTILHRIVQATQVDTVVHTFLETNSIGLSGRSLHEINVIGTLNLLAAAGAPGTPVRHVVVKSSTHIYGSSEKDPAWFREETRRQAPVRTRVERSLLEVEAMVRDFADDNPHLIVSVLRFANVLGTDIVTPISTDLRKRILPCILGFDPLVQFVEEDDVVRSLEHVTAESDSRRVQCGRGGKAALERGGHDRRCPPLAPSTAQPPRLCLAVASTGHRAVPPGDGSGHPLRPGRRHLPPDRDRLPLSLHLGRSGRELCSGQQPAPDGGLQRERLSL